jgi:hypothetical protein
MPQEAGVATDLTLSSRVVGEVNERFDGIVLGRRQVGLSYHTEPDPV